MNISGDYNNIQLIIVLNNHNNHNNLQPLPSFLYLCQSQSAGVELLQQIIVFQRKCVTLQHE